MNDESSKSTLFISILYTVVVVMGFPNSEEFELSLNVSLYFFPLQYYDIRKKCVGSLCYDFSNLEKFLNQKSVRDALGVGDIDFVSCSPTVYQAMLMDWMRNLEVGIPALLENEVKLLVYAGEYDLICNWLGEATLSLHLNIVILVISGSSFNIQIKVADYKNFYCHFYRAGNSRWVHAMEWSGQKEFVSSPEVPFQVDGSEAGLLTSHGPLSFLKVSLILPPLDTLMLIN